MITKEILKEVIVSQKKIFLDTKDSFWRNVLGDTKFTQAIFKTAEIVVITGVRRCGKSYLLRLIWQEIQKKLKFDNNQFLYFNFEDERIVNFTVKDFDLLLTSFQVLFNPKVKKKIYLFFDEIQNISGWEKFLNRLRENKHYKVIVTGSNATLMSQEISSRLTGRTISLNLYPFSFSEYLLVKFPNWQNKYIFDSDKKIVVEKLFGHYLQIGGFPEVIKTDKKILLQDYFQGIIYRDILARYKIRQEASFREMVSFLLSNIGTILSIEKIARLTKIQNLSSVKNYQSYLSNSFLFYFIPKYSYSIKEQIYNPDKVYIGDLGFYNQLSFHASANQGRILENFVFLELLRVTQKVFYGLDKDYGEIDFVVSQNNQPTDLIQVCANLANPLTKQRETNSLLKAMEKYRLRKGYILTLDYYKEEKFDQGTIYFLPAWQYFLSQP